MRRHLLPLVLVSLMLTSSMASVIGAAAAAAIEAYRMGLDDRER